MKAKIYFFLAALLPICSLCAQPTIPNGGFETWDTTGHIPTSWTADGGLPGLVNRDTDAHSGNYAARVKVLKVDTAYVLGSLSSTFRYGLANPVTLNVWIKTHLKGTDKILINPITLYRDAHTTSVIPAGTGTRYMDSTTNSNVWTQISVSLIFPDSNNTASDSSTILFEFINARDTSSYFIIDDLSYSDVPTLINEVAETVATQKIYPNPADATENLIYSVSRRTPVSLEVYNLAGEKVESVIDETQNTGVYKAEIVTTGLPVGMYVAVLKSPGNIVQEKFMVAH